MRTTLSGEDTYKLLIGGEWVSGGDGAYPIVNPATEEVVADAPEASADQARAAAAAAAEAFPAWSRTRPAERAALLQAAADELKQRVPDFIPLVIEETGATSHGCQHDAGADCSDALRALRGGSNGADGHPVGPAGDAGNRARARRADGCARPAGARRCRRVHHLVQLPDREHGREARARPRDGEHRGGATRRSGSARRDRDREAARRRRLPAGRREHRDGLDPGVGSGARGVTRCRHGELHRLDQRRDADRRGRGPGR